MQQNSNKEPVKNKIEDNVQDVKNNVGGAVQEAKQEVSRSRVPWYRALKRAQILIAVYFLLFALFGLLAAYVHFNPVIPADIKITREFQEEQYPLLTFFMIAVSFIGAYPVLFASIVLLAAVAFWTLGLRLEGVLVVALSVVSAILNSSIKLLINRPRPTASLVEVITVATGKSFPSGHVMSYVAFWGLLFSLGLILFKRDRWWHYALLIVPVLFVILVGPSRIYLGDHWASDVLGAYMLGGLLLGISLWIYLGLKQRGVLAPPRVQPGEPVAHPSHSSDLQQHAR